MARLSVVESVTLDGVMQGLGRPDEDIRDGFALTNYFLHQHVFEPRGAAAPEERARLVALATADEGSRG